MTFPSIVNRGGGETAAGTVHAVPLPDGSNVSGRLLVYASLLRGGAAGTWSIPSGFTAGWPDEIGPGAGTATPIFGLRYKILNGTEGYAATGATQSATSSDSMQAAHRSWLFEAGTFDTVRPLEALTFEQVTTTNPDPPSLSIRETARDIHWIALAGIGDDTVHTGYPANYTTGQFAQPTTAGNALLQAAERALNGVTENPGTFSSTSSGNVIAATIAIRPNMGAMVYGPDTFTVAADTNLEVYDPNWIAKVGTLSVRATTDDVRNTNAGVNAGYRWTGKTLVDQKIIGNLLVVAGKFPGLFVRAQPTTEDGYQAEWDDSLTTVRLYRVTGGATPVYTFLAQGGLVSPATFSNAYLKVTGTNPCVITAGDDTNGADIINFSDSNAARWQSGQPGMSVNQDNLQSSIDNVSIYDETLAWVYGLADTGAIDDYAANEAALNDEVVLGVLFTQSVDGAITPTGLLVLRTNKALAGSLLPTGALTRAVSRNFGGAIVPTGALTRRIDKLLSGGLAPSGTLTVVRIFLVSVAGALAPSGDLSKRINKLAAGSVTPGGALTRAVNKFLVGGIAPSGALLRAKRTVLDLAGAVSPSGIVARRVNKLLTGTVTPGGVLDKILVKLLSVAGAITPAGALLKRVNKTLVGGVTPSGALLRVKKAVLELVGALSPSGIVARRVNKLLTGGVTPSGLLDKLLVKLIAVTGSIAPSGVLSKRANRNMAGSVAPSGGLVRRVSKALLGALAPEGLLTRRANKLLAGGTTPSSILTTLKVSLKAITGSIAPSGLVSRRTNKLVGGGLNPSGTAVKRASKPLSADVAPSGGLVKRANRLLVGALAPSGALTRQVAKLLLGATTPAGAVQKRTGKVVAGTVAPSGTVGRRVSAWLQGAVAPAGALQRRIGKFLSGAVAPVGILTYRAGILEVIIEGVIAPSGALSKRVARSLGGALLPSGNLTRRIGKALRGEVRPLGRLGKWIVGIGPNLRGKFMSGPRIKGVLNSKSRILGILKSAAKILGIKRS